MTTIPSSLLCSVYKGNIKINEEREKCYKSSCGIDYLTSPISYEEFLVKYLLPNKACILGNWATAGWKSREEWVNSDGSPNLDFLREHFGDVVAPVANCNQELFSSHIKEDQQFSKYVDYLMKYRSANYDPSFPCFYLKDWHFVRGFPDYIAYETPVFFQSDWLNEFWDNRKDSTDDYRFVYVGPKGSWTPFHSDVQRSYSWSANICGRKLWYFYVPGDEVHLTDKYGLLAFDLRSADLEDSSRYPTANQARRLEVIQEQGEVIFVPSRWHHQVFNLEDTISINHNWMNGCNVDLVWEYITQQLEEVKKEISDCHDMDDWPGQCQLILKASSGTDYYEFFDFIHLIAQRRIEFLDTSNAESEDQHDVLEEASDKAGFERSSDSRHCREGTESDTKLALGVRRHAIFDLLRIKVVLEQMLQNPEFLQLKTDKWTDNPKDFHEILLEQIEKHFVGMGS